MSILILEIIKPGGIKLSYNIIIIILIALVSTQSRLQSGNRHI